MNKKVVLGIVVVVCLGLVSFFMFKPNAYSYEVDSEYVVAKNLDELKGQADIIVKGKLMSYAGEVLGNNGSKYRNYKFKTDEVIKGATKANPFNISFEAKKQGTMPIDGKEYVFMYDAPLFFEPNLGEDYIIFLNYDYELDSYCLASEPGIIKVEADQVFFQSNTLNKNIREEKMVQEIEVAGKKIIVKNKLKPTKNFIEGMDFYELEHNLYFK